MCIICVHSVIVRVMLRLMWACQSHNELVVVLQMSSSSFEEAVQFAYTWKILIPGMSISSPLRQYT